MIQILGLLLLCFGAAAGDLCTLMTLKLKQLDAGAGQVYGVNDNGNVYKLAANNSWTKLPGGLTHVTVGPAGIWGVNSANAIYTFRNNNWVQVKGLLNQIDAGGNAFVVGTTSSKTILCLNQDQTLSTSTSPTYTSVDGGLKYYSCGPCGCWGVNSNNGIFYRYGVQPMACQGSQWQSVEGTLTRVEVGTDCSVYGLSPMGDVYRREGVSGITPLGTHWTLVKIYCSVRHVSYDQGTLWLIGQNKEIYRCEVSCPGAC